MVKKVAIIGKKIGKYQAPFYDLSYEIWGCNKHDDFNNIPRFTKWFDLHDKTTTRFNNLSIKPLITVDEYPYDEIEKMLNGKRCNNSMAYMIAYAIYKGYQEIKLYGCDFVTPEEIRTHQRINVVNLLYFAMGKGIKVFSYEGLLTEYEQYK